MSTVPTEPDMSIDVRASVAVDPRIVDINLLSEAIQRITGCFCQLMQILHAQDATDMDKLYVTRCLEAMLMRVEFEFKPEYKAMLNAVKH